MRRTYLLVVVLLAWAGSACSGSIPAVPATTTSNTLASAEVEPGPATTTTVWSATAEPCVDAGSWGVCDIEGYEHRPYDIYLPSAYDADASIPVVLALHGGGGKAENAITTTCADGDRTSPSCLHNIAEAEGFAVVYPNGTGFGLLPSLKTWNAGGGSDDYNCVSGQACERNIDDIAYFTTLLDDLESWLNVDTGMVYATGLSNGAAMSHRLACEMSQRFTAIAAVGGTNQFAATAKCDLAFGVSIMQIHGTGDPCWTYEASTAACADRSGGIKVGVAESTADWVSRLHCETPPAETELPDPIADQTTTTRTVWIGCNAGATEVHLMTVHGGGHTWPGGDPYLAGRVVGRVTHDWDSTLIWEFFSRFDRTP